MTRVQLLASLLLVCLIAPEFAKADTVVPERQPLTKAGRLLASPMVAAADKQTGTDKSPCAFGGIHDSIGMLGKGFLPLLASPLGSETVIEPGSGAEALAAWKNRCLTIQRASESKLTSEQSFNSFSNTYGIEAAGTTKYFPNVPPVGIQVNGDAYKDSVLVARTFSHVKELGIVGIEDDCLADSMSQQFKIAVLQLRGLSFDPSDLETAKLFYQFFATWGTLYVDSVTYGAMVYAYESRKLESSGISGKASVEAELEKIKIGKASAEASGARSSVSGQVEVQGSVVGGTMSSKEDSETDGLDTIKAQFGHQKDNRLTDIATSSAFAGMKFETGPKTAAPIAYNLKPIANLLVNFHHRVTGEDLRAAFPDKERLTTEEKQDIARIYPNVRAALKAYNSLIVRHRAKVDMMVPVAERMAELIRRAEEGHHFKLSKLINRQTWESNIRPRMIPVVIQAKGHMYGVATKDALQNSANYFLEMLQLPVPVFKAMLNDFAELARVCSKLMDERWGIFVVPYRWEALTPSTPEKKTAVLTSSLLEEFRDGYVDVTAKQQEKLEANSDKLPSVAALAAEVGVLFKDDKPWLHKPDQRVIESFELPEMAPASSELVSRPVGVLPPVTSTGSRRVAVKDDLEASGRQQSGTSKKASKKEVVQSSGTSGIGLSIEDEEEDD
eukprot:GILJ01000329.1.p1 GENE.GILJ01000329.1~~GILJ01000329.1.p1  ORF type:complete len:671 (-),score=116.47 GILJ01000329.1:223-2235(-)